MCSLAICPGCNGRAQGVREMSARRVHLIVPAMRRAAHPAFGAYAERRRGHWECMETPAAITAARRKWCIAVHAHDICPESQPGKGGPSAPQPPLPPVRFAARGTARSALSQEVRKKSTTYAVPELVRLVDGFAVHGGVRFLVGVRLVARAVIALRDGVRRSTAVVVFGHFRRVGMSGRKVRGGKSVKRRLGSGNLENRAEQVGRLEVTSVSQWDQRHKVRDMCACMWVRGKERRSGESGSRESRKDETPRDGGSVPSSLSRATTVGRAAECEAAAK